MYITILRFKTNVEDAVAILAKMSFPQHVSTTVNVGVVVKTLCCGRDK